MIRWKSRLSDHFLSSAARTVVKGCVRGSTLRIFRTESRRSPDFSYSSAWARNASTFISWRWLPPAIFIRPRMEAWTSCPTSSPARSAESSDLRNHSRSAVTMAMIATFPSGIQAILSARPVRKSSTVRYTE